MGIKFSLILLSILTFFLFTFLSYTVAKEVWQKIDFDVTVKLQDHVPRSFDGLFSYFSFLGSAEVTVGMVAVLAFLSLIRGKILAFLGWLLILPASFFEVFGKLVVFHPAPPVLFHRNIFEGDLPSFYIHTNFSYPSGHMTRTIFLIVVLLILIWVARKHAFPRLVVAGGLVVLALLMGLTRVYLGEHWLSDVLGGGLLGMSAGLFASSLIISKKAVKIKKI